MDDLVRWLSEQYDEDERRAQAATDGPWTPWRGSTVHGLGDLIHAVLTPGQKPGAKAEIVTASWLDAEHIAEWDPARVLREIYAKRQIIAGVVPEMDGMTVQIHQEFGVGPMDPSTYESLVLLRLLALPYADRPGYREEWRP